MPGVQIVTMELSRGREWLWYPDLNILALSPALDEAGRDRCIDELLAQGRDVLRGQAALVEAPVA